MEVLTTELRTGGMGKLAETAVFHDMGGCLLVPAPVGGGRRPELIGAGSRCPSASRCWSVFRS